MVIIFDKEMGVIVNRKIIFVPFSTLDSRPDNFL